MTDVILQSLTEKKEQLLKEESELKEKIFSDPLSEIIKQRKEVMDIRDKYGIDSKEFGEFLNKAAKREKELFEIADWQHNNLLKSTETLAKLSSDINKLTWEISRLS
jgi:hypothetical protein